MSHLRFLYLYTFVWLGFLNVLSCEANADPNRLVNVQYQSQDLRPEPEHWKICKDLANVILTYNFKKVPLDAKLAAEVFHKYLKNLDPSKTILLASDIQGFEPYRDRLQKDIKSGNLEGAYKIYNCFLARYIETLDFINNLLEENKIITSSDEKLLLDRKDAEWFGSQEAKNRYWEKRISYDVITQKLIDKSTLQKAIEVVMKRYKNLRRYLKSRKSEDVFELFMNSFCETVEPHTTYLSATSAEQFKIDMSKSLEGIGATLRTNDLFTKVEEVIHGGPAYKSKQIEAGDKIIAVAQGPTGEFEDIRGLFITEVVKKIRGPKGSIVRLRIIPHNASATTTKDVTIVRDKITVEEQKVSSKIIEKKQGGKKYKLGLITLPSFYIDWDALAKGEANYNSSSNDVKKAVIKLKEEGVDGLIIDLQDNGGGSLPEAVALTGLFIGKGPVVQIKESSGRVQENTSEIAKAIYDGPIVILTNIFSASASEILAGAMQDYGRGVIFGSRTYGKGTVQTVLNVGEDILGQKGANFGQLNITIAQFYRVNGASTQAKGVVPDIVFPSTYPDTLFGESANKHALPYNSIAPSLYTKWADLGPAIKYLSAQHEERMQKSQIYKLILENIEKVKKAREVKEVRIDERALLEEQEKEKAELLIQTNKFRAALGLKPIKKGDKVPKLDYNFLKEEANDILLDLIRYNSGAAQKLDKSSS